MIHLIQALKLLGVSALLAVAMLAGISAAPPLARSPERPPPLVPAPPPEVRFMREFLARVNPSLPVEDPDCALLLPAAIHRSARAHALDWRPLLTLAWQESDFDCHAKNRADRGGAYGPFQLRRVWGTVIGDPRPQYFDPELAAERVAQVILYYQETQRLQNLIGRRYRNPLLCLYNSGETRRVNTRYCRQVGAKLKAVRQAWREFTARETRQARNEAARSPAAG
jgi:hypothetical protein